MGDALLRLVLFGLALYVCVDSYQMNSASNRPTWWITYSLALCAAILFGSAVVEAIQ